MVREVVHDPIFLGGKSESATKDDLPVAQDLLDTLIANKAGCVGMAANMIGVRKRIIVFDCDGSYMTMFNPEILKASEQYDTQEGCLSLLGGPRPCSATDLSKCSGKMRSSKPGSRPLPVGLPKSYSTRSTTAMAY